MKSIPRTFLAVLTIGLLSCCLFSSGAQAAPVQGDIDFNGVVTFDTMSLAAATRVNVWNNSFVIQDSGDFGSIAQFTNVTMTAPWIFNSGTPGSPLPGPITDPLWQVGGFTFHLASSMVTSQTTTFLDVEGVGTITGNGFDPTPGIWNFTSSVADGGMHATFGFQSTTAAVPEASSAGLFGMGLLGLVGGYLLRRKFKAA